MLMMFGSTFFEDFLTEFLVSLTGKGKERIVPDLVVNLWIGSILEQEEGDVIAVLLTGPEERRKAH